MDNGTLMIGAQPIAHARGSIMASKSRFHRVLLSALGASILFLSGCVSAPGTYPDYNGPRNGDGFLIDPRTGLELPGQADPGL
jgi:hypothetical protein